MSFLSKARKESGLSQIKLASILGVKSQSVSNWERGAAPIPRKYADSISRALKIDKELIINEIMDHKIINIKKRMGEETI